MTSDTRPAAAIALRRRLTVAPRALRRRPQVCVVVSVYNYARYLESCVTSVLGQEGVVLDILIVDDASTDDSVAVARSLAAKDPRIRIITHERNQGHIATFNEGLRAADGDYVVKLDADDMLTPGSLARSAAVLDAFSSVGLVYGFPVVFRDEDPPPPRLNTRSWTIWPGADWLERMCQRATNVIAQPEVMMRVSALRDVGLFRADLPHTSDFEMWLRMSTRHDIARINGVDQGYYRIHAKSMSRTVNAGAAFDMAARLLAFNKLFDDSKYVNQTFLAIAKQALAREAIGYALSACARGVVEDEPVDEYLSIAVAAWPRASEWRSMRSARRLRHMQPAVAKRRPSSAVRRVIRDVEGRIEWRRWRWRGI